MAIKRTTKKQVEKTVAVKTAPETKAVDKDIAAKEIALTAEVTDALVEVITDVAKPSKTKKATDTKEELVEEKKEPNKKTTVKEVVEKEPEVEVAPKKTASSAIKESIYIQYAGREFEKQAIMEKIKSIWVTDGNKVKDLKSLCIYIKPEENLVYYVINEDVKGKFEL